MNDCPAVFLLVAIGFPSYVPAAFLSRLHRGCSCPRKIALPLSELSPAFECPFRSRDPMRHFHIGGLVGRRSCMPFLLLIWDRCVLKFRRTTPSTLDALLESEDTY